MKTLETIAVAFLNSLEIVWSCEDLNLVKIAFAKAKAGDLAGAVAPLESYLADCRVAQKAPRGPIHAEVLADEVAIMRAAISETRKRWSALHSDGSAVVREKPSKVDLAVAAAGDEDAELDLIERDQERASR